MKNENNTKLNILSAVCLQLITIISGFIIPRIILKMFGSEINGLISSVTQFLNYIQLIEGGLGGVVMAALYSPLSRADHIKVSGIVNATSSFFKKIGVVYIIYALGVSFIYPLFVNTGFNYWYSLVLVLALGTNLVVQYFFSITYKLLLNADRKVYIVSFTQSVILLLNVVLVAVCSYIFKDILFIKFISALIFAIQPLVFSAFVKKYYCIDKTVAPDREALSQRWVAFGTNFAYFVHTNTDIVILTVFSTLTNISVYSVYLLVVNALKGFIIAISSAVVPSFGRALSGSDKTKIEETFSKYEFLIHITSFIIFTTGAIMIVPFILLYTRGVNDADYNQPVFALIILLAEFIYCLRDPYVQSTSAAGMFKEVAPHAYIESGINILISVILVNKYGLIGVAIGTIAAMIYRLGAQVIILNNRILKKRTIAYFGKIVLLVVISLTIYYLHAIFGYHHIDSYLKWLLYALLVFSINVIVAVLICELAYRKQFRSTIIEKMTRK